MLDLLPNEVILAEQAGLTVTNRRILAGGTSGWFPRKTVQVWIPLENIDSIEAGQKRYTGLLILGVVLTLVGVLGTVAISLGVVFVAFAGLLAVAAFFLSRQSGAFVKSAATTISVASPSHADLSELISKIDKARSGRLLSMQQATSPRQAPATL